MKKFIITLVIAGMFASCGETVKEGSNFKITGKIGNLNAPAKIYLGYMSNGEQVDSSAINNGKFSFSGTVNGQAIARVILDYTGDGIQKALWQGNVRVFYLEEGTLVIESKDSLQNLAFIDSPINAEHEAYLEYIGGDIQKLADIMNARYAAASPEQQSDTAFIASLNRDYRKLLDERADKQFEYTRTHADKYFGLVALSEASNLKFDMATVEPLFNSIDEKYRNTDTWQSLAKRINAEKTIEIGKPAPDFTQLDVNDKPVKLSDFRGKYVLLDFWASWCGPCRAESPHLVKAYAKYKNKNFDILGVSLDRVNNRDEWLNAIAQDKLTWTHVADVKNGKHEAAQLYGVRGIPANYLIDPQGIIIDQNLRGEALDSVLNIVLTK
ncbi:MAG: AhpC/TSA family protein [Prevotellaceae bacterium]|jgi:peroxiredoxin|nr:AhpC/TSA family protein [Prevotellaceae bacterium]